MTKTTEDITIVGNSLNLAKKRVKKFAEKSLPVLFSGERGVGKELFAKFYMDNSPKKGKKEAVNCVGIPELIFDSELFGHIKGAFTDAIKDRPGLIKTCEGGIIFLDEIGDLSGYLQAKLLRVVEGYGYKKVGSDKAEKADVTFIAATNKLEKVRKDLQDRFHIVYLPTLKQQLHMGDFPLFINSFLKKIQSEWEIRIESITDIALMSFYDYDWPGNVRELKQVIEEIILFGNSQPVIKYNDLPIRLHLSYRGELPRVELPPEDIKVNGSPHPIRVGRWGDVIETEVFISDLEKVFPKLSSEHNQKVAEENRRWEERLALEEDPIRMETTLNSDLGRLLKIESLPKATKEFQKEWVEYNLKLHGSLTEIAQKSGLTKSRFSQLAKEFGIKV